MVWASLMPAENEGSSLVFRFNPRQCQRGQGCRAYSSRSQWSPLTWCGNSSRETPQPRQNQ